MADPYSVEFTRYAYRHLESFRRRDRNRILDGIRQQLARDPSEETQNKKVLRRNPLADWELRIHPFRVFYEVDEESRKVRIVAIGVKQRDRLFIGGKEVQL